MEIVNRFRRKSRVVKEICDTRWLMALEEGRHYPLPSEQDYPVYLTVNVQVKIWFVRLTVWAESCDITDGDATQHILSRAERLRHLLEEGES